ncbi:unnamed protein product [Polarella glacialis]|uniref:ribonuclease H n=1 Tax=Polarella glacialis TaxID=89957 RepID=A0A813H6T0_POLGL|nr:unnamed protein product [Polarella glacialis]
MLRPPMNRQHVSLESPSTGRAEEFFHDGKIVVFTDGACSNNQDDRFRRAGYGAYWADGHALNFSLALEGWAQTNNRAELMAVIQTIEQEGRPLEIRTDSRQVHNGALFHIASWRESGWRHVSNADLWQRLDKALSLRCKDSVRFVKVKGHATARHVRAGVVSQFDKLGNDAADKLATNGADLNHVDPTFLASAKCKQELAVYVQNLMLAILCARGAAVDGQLRQEAAANAHSLTSSDSQSNVGSSCSSDDSSSDNSSSNNNHSNTNNNTNNINNNSNNINYHNNNNNNSNNNDNTTTTTEIKTTATQSTTPPAISAVWAAEFPGIQWTRASL